MLALIHNDTIVKQVAPGGWFDLPDGSRASPAEDGWTNGDYRLAAILPADAVPEGKRIVSTSVELVEGQPKHVHVLEDIPPSDLYAYAAAKRYEVETGGITVNGATVDTSRDSQSMITGAYAYSQAHPEETIHFKAASGWVTLDAATLAVIATAVGAHVQACFAVEAAVAAEIEAGTITTTAEIDAADWPEGA